MIPGWWSRAGADHAVPSNVNALPSSSSATQYVDVAHDSAAKVSVELESCSVERWDHVDPLYANVWPARSIATQSVVVGHDTRRPQPCWLVQAGSTGTAADHVVPSKRNAFPCASSAMHWVAV